MAWNSDTGNVGWEEAAIDATAEAAFEAKALALGLSGVVLVENVKLAVPSLAGCLRRALSSALTAALGVHMRKRRTSTTSNLSRSSRGTQESHQEISVRIRPGGGSALARNCPVGASAFSFAVLPEDEDRDMVERLREHLLLEEVYSGGVCLLPELKAKLEDHGISSKCRLTIEVTAPERPASPAGLHGTIIVESKEGSPMKKRPLWVLHPLLLFLMNAFHKYTIIDLFEKAAKPSRVFIGVCWQVDREEDADCFLLQPPSSYAGQVRTLFLHHSEARGPCYARARIQQELFQGEDFYFQLDSHFRMIPKWDEELIHQLGMCESKKPILSTYPSSYTLPEDYRPGMPDAAELPKSIEPIALCAREFGPDGFLRITGKKCKTFSSPRTGLFWAAGFAFSSGQVVKEVPYDIRLEDLFFGEESSMAVRLWTSGWDFFAPTKVMGYHLWTRKHRPVFREHDSQDQRQRQAASQKRVTMQLTGGDGQSSHEPPAARSLRDYEEFAGISFEKRKLSARALRGGMDPGDFMDEAPADSGDIQMPGSALVAEIFQRLGIQENEKSEAHGMWVKRSLLLNDRLLQSQEVLSELVSASPRKVELQLLCHTRSVERIEDYLEMDDEISPLGMSFAFCGPSGSGKSRLLRSYAMKESNAMGLPFMRVHLRVEEALVRYLWDQVDLKDQRQVSAWEAQQLADAEGLSYFETSALHADALVDAVTFAAAATPSQPSKSPYPQGLPNNIASTIQAMLGKDTAAGAPTVLLTPLSSTPPRLLSAPTRELRLLQPQEVEQLNSCGICIIDAFLRDRCYGPFADEVDPAEATRLVRRAAQCMPLRPAGLGGGEGVWRSQKVRGDEMTWLNVPDMAGGFQCGVKALQRACEVMPPAANGEARASSR
eukprot:s1156_g41.t2